MHGSVPSALDALVAQVRGRPQAMIRLARTLLLPRGQAAEARALVHEAMALAPNDPEVAALAGSVLARDVGSWYFTMVQDHDRHALYEAALARVVRPDSVVLDIGAGTGLFAMMAARAGAAKVIACERDPVVAEAATAVVAANGLSDRVTILPIASQALSPDHLPALADVLLWDNLGNNLWGAGCAATLRDAQQRLLAPDAAVLPSRVEIIAALATDHKPAKRLMTQAAGFDLTPFNHLRQTGRLIREGEYTLASDPATLFDVDCTARHLVEQQARKPVAAHPGTVHGVVQWLRFHLGEGISYETRGDTVTAFGVQFHGIEPFTLDAPTTVTIGGGHDTLDTWFWAEPPQ
ncbi:50S ribosomal protein L11 methyltransferase [Novosphingobium cyanobacteriorum]|uniref:50S ribosomal protein L11 methyltransferase n=1 Tax=Novosphingobium cyanobacteriorum TaxID=3024215 RepID=A0ABT6CF50_9SPHN|nr:50S ribosomal protein L11 methyltransferase [Novosphingobium cyanobacteriorum]MDF8332457.1 50S ribosomal protein L11 methyltransferase [Novosphingobium cyanobacteriorum]